jgi:hypothetical protein
MCAFYAERCVLSSCSGMFYDGAISGLVTQELHKADN